MKATAVQKSFKKLVKWLVKLANFNQRPKMKDLMLYDITVGLLSKENLA